MDMSKVPMESRTNEMGTTVQAAKAANVETALHAMVAMLKQRRALFLKDAVQFKYAAPSTEDLVCWTYVYFNVGPYIGDKSQGGKGQLKKYQGQRKLGDWIKKGEYANAIKDLQTYRAVQEIYRSFKPQP
jgi:hypothetical protein